MKLIDIIDEIRIGFDWLPKTKKRAEAFGRRSAICGCHIDNNPYDRVDNVVWKTYTNCGPTHMVHLNEKRRQLSLAYHYGFGKVVWDKMNEGYVAYPGFFSKYTYAPLALNQW